MTKRKKKMNANLLAFLKVVGIFSVALVLFFLFFLYRLDVLPTHYYLLISIILFGLDLFAVFAIFKFKKVLKWIAFVFVCVFSCISSVGSYYLYHTDAFLNQSFRNQKFGYNTTYYLITASESSKKEVFDIQGAIAYYKGSNEITKAMEQLNKKMEQEMEYQAFDDVITMFESVLSGSLETMLVEKTNFDLVFQVSSTFSKEQYKVLDEYTIYTEIEGGNSGNDRKFNVYIGGNDFTESYMDFNMIVSVNLNTKKILMTSLPRDFYIPVSGYNGSKDTLSYMGARGVETNRKSLEEFLGISLDYFVKINTNSLVGIVDELGGITYCSDTSYTTTHALILGSYDDSKGNKLHVQKGCQRFNGIEALTVARERKAFPDGDRQRQKNCQQIIMAILKEFGSFKTITNYNNVLESLSDLYQTNIPRDVITNVIKYTIDGAEWNIESQSMNGSDSRNYVHMTNLTDYVMEPNMDSVQEAVARIKEIIN